MKHLSLVAIWVLAFASVATAQHLLGAPQQIDGNIRFIADFDGDGDQDLLRANTGLALQGTVTVLLNDGTGSFTDGPQTPLFANYAEPAAVADYTGDGVADMAVIAPVSAVPSGPGIFIHPGLSGGNFGVPIFIPLEGGAFSIDSGDVNGDGRVDLAILNFDQVTRQKRLRWFVSTIGNVFTPSAGLTFGLFSNGPFKIKVADVDADNVPDVVGSGVSPAAVMLFPTFAGDLTDGADITMPLGFNSDPRMSLGDFNGDGLIDIFTHESVVGGIQTAVALNGGVSAWTAGPVTFFADVALGEIFHADWDNDGDVDAFVRGSPDFGGDYSLLVNDGAGTFTLGFNRQTSSLANGGAGFADLDSDGFIDFVGANDIWFGSGSPVDHHIPVGTFANLVADYDRDGDDDIIGFGGDVYFNNGKGEFTLDNRGFPQPPGMFFYEADMMANDFNQDGIPDYLVSYLESPGPFMTPIFHEMRILRGTAQGGFVDDQVAAAPAGLQMDILDGRRTPFADANGDGLLDVFARDGIWRAVTPGSYLAPVDAYPGWRPVDSADLDGDGDIDLLAYSKSTPFMVAILRHDGNLGFTPEVLAATGFSSEPQDNIARFRDLDDDGLLDVAYDYGISGATTIEIAKNLGASFAPGMPLPISVSLGDTTIDGADINGDGLTDLVIGNASGFGASFLVLLRTGPGFVYEEPRRYLGGGMVHLRDIDNDGDTDILGGAVTFNRNEFGATGGSTRQFGVGSVGNGGFVPLLSMNGPVRPGEVATISLRHATGAATAILLAGNTSIPVPNAPFPGNTLYVSSIVDFYYFYTNGAFGAAGVGESDVPVLVPANLAGLEIFLQYVIVDFFGAAPLTTTNAVEVKFGS
ncbi:MAG: hypothetical protein ACI97A_003493 [Planctomycetota bacterium]|jgi:hypothetical protein